MSDQANSAALRAKAEASLKAQSETKGIPSIPGAGTETAVAKERPKSVSQQLQVYMTKHKNQIELALPKHLSADRMIRVAMTMVSKNPLLQKCDAGALFGSVIQSLQLGLEPDNGLGHSWILPYKNVNRSRELGYDSYDPQLIIGYQGMNELAFRSGMIKSMHGDIVYRQDEFDFAYGSSAFLKHKPTHEETKQDDWTCVYAYAELSNGGTVFIVLKKAEVLAAMARSMSNGGFGPWKSDFNAMAIKTAYRRLFKKLPKSPEIATALKLDGLAEQSIPQGLDISKTQADGTIPVAEFSEYEEVEA